MRRLSIKVWVAFACTLMAVPAFAFNSLSCQGDLDVRLKGPNAKSEKLVQKFTIKKIEALELELSFGGVAVGRLFPWDHVVWEPDAGLLKKFKDVKFKTDDERMISLVFASMDGTKHKFNCLLDFDFKN